MKLAFYSAVIMISFIIQTTSFHFTNGLMLWPDLALLLAIHGGFRWGKGGGAYFGGLTGLLQDMFSYGAMGGFFFTKSVTGFIVGVLRERYVNDSHTARAIAVVVATPFDFFAYGFLTQTFIGYDLTENLSHLLPPQVAINLIFSFIMLPFLSWANYKLDKLYGPEDERYRYTPYK